MKRCTTTHTVDAFGVIPVGSLWDDDSPYTFDQPDLFEPVDEEPPAPVVKPVRKFGAKPAPTEES